MRVAALGDSITAGSPGWDPSPAVRAGIAAPDPRSQWPFWAERTTPGVTFVNHGVNRERTDQIALRLDAALSGADAIVLQGGINDVVQGRPLDLVVADVDAMIERALRRVGTVVVVDVLPWNNGDDESAETILGLNARLRAVAAARGVPMLPFYETLEDPGRPRRMAPAWTAEGNHPSVEGHRRLGEIAWPAAGVGEPSSLVNDDS